MRRITNIIVCSLAIMSLFSVARVTAAEVGRNINANSTLSYEQIKQAAENGDADAQYALGYMCFYGKGGVQKNMAEAKKWIAKAAANKQPQAIHAQELMLAAEQKSSLMQNQSSQVVKNTAVAQNDYLTAKETISKSKEANHENQISVQREKEIQKEAEKETLVDMHHVTPNFNISSSEKRLLAVPDSFYTVQLLAGANKSAIDRMLTKNDLQDKSSVYRTYRNAKSLYVLIYGKYKTKAQANVAAMQLQKKLKLEPWVKSYASVKKSINTEHRL